MAEKIREVEEEVITRAIIRKAMEDWISLAETDVVVVGAGPSGLTAARYLAKAGLKTVVFERKLSFGGGIGGGGMQFHKIVVQSPADKILRDVGCKLEPLENGLFIVDAADLMAKLACGAIDAGAKIILGVTVEDLIYRDSPTRIVGVVVQWTSVIMAGIHVDPLAVKAKAVIDCTGHDAEVIAVASRKIPELAITIRGEKSMWSSLAEELTLKNTREICPGLFAAGMAVAAIDQAPRMGPIFGGMLLSGAKIAQLVTEKLKGKGA
ncbi:MAG: sulfide-dependent adenosine diphosphate thiazole synthase [Candidatus Bathyarchaeota archaeon]|nr:sulfide-dependent adenosine diphosphate thiazole synthase [Candidatus Bathyarchaeota archaeon]MCX8177661.1 sulfide-dependent adenosine diphosphate thiazole synthase [Candidatus Bathyarchaeota archaeon]MDW8193916.1 sulfide-dependent adenosine diphosphate thiazole synthase [Nitrososphaerota archaeon]